MHPGYLALAGMRYLPIKVGEVGGQARPQPRIPAPTSQALQREPGHLLDRHRSLGSRVQLPVEPLDTPSPLPANLSPWWTSRLVTVTGADGSFPGGGVVCWVPEHAWALSACCFFLMPSQFLPVVSSRKLGKWTVICVEVGVGGVPRQRAWPQPTRSGRPTSAFPSAADTLALGGGSLLNAQLTRH